MNTYPLESINLEEAKKLQFKMIDCITKNFSGKEILNRGDLGVVMGLNKPETTLKAEKAIADFFGTESAVLTRGSGTGAIRWGLISFLKSGDTILIHKAPVYPTTEVTLQTMGINTVSADFNSKEETEKVLRENPEIKGVLVQHTRQKIDDSYVLGDVIKTVKDINKDLPVIVDDNYAIMKTHKNGTDCGADLSAFSCFKLLGPEGVGCVIGKKEFTEKIIALNYSGGSQVQGHEALDVLHGMVYAPVSLALQAEVTEEVAKIINSGSIKGVKKAYIANSQSKVLLVELEEDIAYDVLKEAEKMGAIPNPVGSESKYEFAPLFYRISGTFRKSDPGLEYRMIRINPMRSGPETILRILENAVKNVWDKR
ncbi:MAG TPA: aminotransferase class V-fold PLP-dependent enzyme [Tepiditoga sp.]|nr:aminotransferase class V-fold PLP-dependent enzyme [Tepiditoga sp.]